MRNISHICLLAVLMAGCAVAPPSAPVALPDPAAALADEQRRMYAELPPGGWVSLADFEDAAQVRLFELAGGDKRASARLTVTTSRTGAGALAVVLPPRCELVARVRPGAAEAARSAPRLLAMAVRVDEARDDLHVELRAGERSWTSHPQVLWPGWNLVQVDLKGAKPLLEAGLSEIRLGFAGAQEPVSFTLDDLMLVPGVRELTGGPTGMVVRQEGLDYRLHVPGLAQPLCVAQSPDGLWRLTDQPAVRLGAEGEAFREGSEDATAMGVRRLGRVELLECNRIRVRLASTWYFPGEGDWRSGSVRRMRWEYTIYIDRCVMSLQLDNPRLSYVQVRWGPGTAVAGDGLREATVLRAPPAAVVSLAAARAWGQHAAALLESYAHPPRLAGGDGKDVSPSGVGQPFVPPDFDDSEGCYCPNAAAGHCRFTLVPPAGGLVNPVIRVRGRWEGPVSASSEGLALRDTVCLADGSLLLRLSGTFTRPVAVEITGKSSPVAP